MTIITHRAPSSAELAALRQRLHERYHACQVCRNGPWPYGCPRCGVITRKQPK